MTNQDVTTQSDTKRDVKRPTLADAPEVLRAREVAKILRISEHKTYRLLESSQIPAVRYGRNWLIPREALLRWLEKISNGETKFPGETQTLVSVPDGIRDMVRPVAPISRQISRIVRSSLRRNAKD
jgi:excisionase family DNA binding protein